MIVICSLISLAFTFSALLPASNGYGGVIWGLMFWAIPWAILFAGRREK